MKELITTKIISLGEKISEELLNKDIIGYNLSISVKKDFFKKLDEDIFYRFKLDEDKENEFIPSENEINLTFGNNTITIKKEKA